MSKVFISVYLSVLAVSDLRYKKIPVWILATGSICAFLWKLFLLCGAQENWQWFCCSILVSVLPGVFMLVLARVSGMVGCGDGWTLVNIGFFLDYKTCILIWIISLFLMSLFSVGMLMAGKARRDTRIPYMPFLVLASLLVFFM